MKPIYLFLLLAVAIVASAVVFTPPDGGVPPPPPPDPTDGHGTGIPTVTTNVSMWTFPGVLTGMPNGGFSALRGAAVEFQPGATDLRGVISLFIGTSPGITYTNMVTVTFSKPFLVPPVVNTAATYTNQTFQNMGVQVRDVTTSNFLISSVGASAANGNRYIISYQVFP